MNAAATLENSPSVALRYKKFKNSYIKKFQFINDIKKTLRNAKKKNKKFQIYLGPDGRYIHISTQD